MAQKTLLEDNSIVIVKADKANIFVILDRFSYYEKSEDFVNSNKFNPVKENDSERKSNRLQYY